LILFVHLINFEVHGPKPSGEMRVPSQLKLERVMRIKKELIDDLEEMDEVVTYDMNFDKTTIGEGVP
jgi:hypothetical protein